MPRKHLWCEVTGQARKHAVCRQEEQTTLKRVVQFLGLGEPSHEELAAMGHVKANRGHAANSQHPGCACAPLLWCVRKCIVDVAGAVQG